MTGRRRVMRVGRACGKERERRRGTIWKSKETNTVFFLFSSFFLAFPIIRETKCRTAWSCSVCGCGCSFAFPVCVIYPTQETLCGWVWVWVFVCVRLSDLNRRKPVSTARKVERRWCFILRGWRGEIEGILTRREIKKATGWAKQKETIQPST